MKAAQYIYIQRCIDSLLQTVKSINPAYFIGLLGPEVEMKDA